MSNHLFGDPVVLLQDLPNLIAKDIKDKKDKATDCSLMLCIKDSSPTNSTYPWLINNPKARFNLTHCQLNGLFILGSPTWELILRERPVIPSQEQEMARIRTTTSTTTTRVSFTMAFGSWTTSRLATLRPKGESSSTIPRMTTALRCQKGGSFNNCDLTGYSQLLVHLGEGGLAIQHQHLSRLMLIEPKPKYTNRSIF